MGIDTVDRPVLDQTGPRGNHNLLARLLIDLHLMHRKAVDEEGLKGRYDINLQWRSDPGQAADFGILIWPSSAFCFGPPS
jgi:hypothetical protein